MHTGRLRMDRGLLQIFFLLMPDAVAISSSH
jgi:hypothetical protein